MVSYQYTYLIGGLIALVIWFILFLYRKDTRKEMLTLSLIFGVFGPLINSIYVRDWWNPLTITRTAVGIEDFLFGFVIGGIAAIIYEHLFRKKIKIKKVNKIKERKRNYKLIFIVGLSIGIFLLGTLLFNLNTFISTLLAFVIPISIIYIKRGDLITNSLISGILTLIGAIIIYQILNLITPGFFDEFWIYQNIGYITIFKIPLEEIIWFFLAGAFIGPLYEYWKEGKLINLKK